MAILVARYPNDSRTIEVQLPWEFFKLMEAKYGAEDVATDEIDYVVEITHQDIADLLQNNDMLPPDKWKTEIEKLDTIIHNGYFKVLRLWHYAPNKWGAD